MNLIEIAKRILYLEEVVSRLEQVRDIAEIRGDFDLVKMINEEILKEA